MNEQRNEFGQPIGPSLANWQPRPLPARVALQGQYCRLEPLDPARHGADLLQAYRRAPDSRDWTYLGSGPFEDDDQFWDFLRRVSEIPDQLHFAVVDSSSEQALGTMALMRIDPANGTIEIGQISFSPALQQTRAATEAQYLLMRLVFDELGYRRYEWKCDSLNARSRRAATRLGFQFEGVFRQAVVYKKRSRDTAWYAVIDSEWPALRKSFVRWLEPGNFEGDRQRVSLVEMGTRVA